MITRRSLILALSAGAFAAPFIVRAQPRRPLPRIGILAAGNQEATARLFRSFLNALKDLGYFEGKDIVFDSRYADGRLDRLPALAAELMARKVDIIFAPTSPAVRAAREVAGAKPIVFAVVNDPVERGLVASLERPGGNITGVMNSASGLAARRLQLLKEAFPSVAHVAIAISREPGATNEVGGQIREVQQAAAAMGIETMPIEIRSRQSFDDASDVLGRWKANALSCLDSSVNWSNRTVLTEFAAKIRLPAIYPSGDYVQAGGLMSYGAEAEFNYRQAATFIDRILKGANPAELAVESPGKLELVINQKAAGRNGISVPRAFLKKADRVIL
jgi:putative tryptophan/tyrosine transport system substrate-binding protein